MIMIGLPLIQLSKIPIQVKVPYILISAFVSLATFTANLANFRLVKPKLIEFSICFLINLKTDISSVASAALIYPLKNFNFSCEANLIKGSIRFYDGTDGKGHFFHAKTREF